MVAGLSVHKTPQLIISLHELIGALEVVYSTSRSRFSSVAGALASDFTILT